MLLNDYCNLSLHIVTFSVPLNIFTAKDDIARFSTQNLARMPSRKGIWPVKNWVVGCRHGYESESRCRFAYGL